MTIPTATFEALLTATATIKRATAGAENAKTGLPAESWASIAHNVPCRVVRRRARQAADEREAVIVRDHLCMLKIGTDVAEGDVIETGGRSYDVTAVDDAAGEGHHLEANVTARSRV